MLSWLILAIILALLVVGVPIYLTLFFGVALFVTFVMQVNPMILASVAFERISATMLIAVPLFILAGQFLALGGPAKPLVNVLNAFMRHITGGPAYAMIAGCVLFAAMASTSMAAIAGFGPILIPMMIGMGYSKSFSTGLLIVSSGLGPLIPPSIILIIYGIIAETSIKDLYTAAFTPGIMVGIFLAIVVFIYSKRGGHTRLPAASWGERGQALWKAWPVLLMPLAVLGPIYGGIATPSEAASICVVYALFLGTVVYRELNLRRILEAIKATLYIMAAVMVIFISAYLLNIALTDARVPYVITEKLVAMGLSKELFLAALIILYLLMGMFLDPSAILLISVPLFLPTMKAFGISPIQYGIIVNLAMELAAVTPPYGFNIFTGVAVLKEPYHVIARSVIMFIPATFLGLLLVSYVPAISLFLVD